MFGFGASQSNTLDRLSRGGWTEVAVATSLTLVYDGLKYRDNLCEVLVWIPYTAWYHELTMFTTVYHGKGQISRYIMRSHIYHVLSRGARDNRALSWGRNIYYVLSWGSNAYHALPREDVLTTYYHEEWYYHEVSRGVRFSRDTTRERLITGYHEDRVYHGVSREIYIAVYRDDCN